MKRAPIADILWLFIATRLLLIAVTYVGYILFPVPPHVYPVQPVDIVGLLTSWNHWDAIHYTQVAQFGYQNIYDTAFFPLFPLLIKGIAFLFGNQGYIAIGMILSNLALLGALFVLYHIAVDILGERVGRRTLLYLCIFPTAFFFFAAYNESLFLLLTAGAFLAMRRQKWWLAGLLGLFAALTRSAGLLLVFPYLYELWVTRQSSTDEKQSVFNQLRQTLPRLLPVVLIPLGTLIYCFYCWKAFNDPIAFSTVQSHWDRQLTLPGVGILYSLGQLFFVQPFGSFYEVHILLDLIATIGFILLAALGWRKLRTSYTLWIGLLLLFTFISPAIHQPDALVSSQRFVLEMFPGFITLAVLGIKHPRLHQAIIITFPFLQAAMALLFVLNRWMV
ncbi:MAG TPA: mannosyltransferase family protein [Ktedonobacteraceae bacterium]|nr:mannosyltransferase family protein [Ktedonobacteraceae bacterium]